MNNHFDLYEKKFKNKIDENKKEIKLSSFLFKIFIKTLIVVVIFLGSLIYIRQSDDNKTKFKNVVYNNSLSFAKIYSVYNKYLGDAIPFKNIFKDNTRVVSSDKITYSNIEKEKNGYMLTVSKEFMLASLKSGIVVEQKKNETYGNIIKIQDKEGLNITYGCLDEVEVKLYDYVEKGELLGKTNEKLYLIFEKDGKYLSYEEYL